MKTYVRKHSDQNLKVFLENFPYDEYLKTVGFTDFATIQEHRYFIQRFIKDEEGNKDGDVFLYYLADKFLSKYPVTANQFDKNILIGEAYLNSTKTLSNPSQTGLEYNVYYKTKTNEAYQIIGYFILSKVAEKIKEEERNDNFDKDDLKNKSYLDRLNKNKVYVSFEESSVSKIFANLKPDKLKYLWGRFIIKVKPVICYLGIVSWFTIVFLIVLLFLEIHLFFKFVSFCLAALLLILKLSINCDSVAKPILFASPNIKQIPVRSFYPINQTENLVDIYELKNNLGKIIGHSVWMKGPEVKAKYFAFYANNHFQKFKNSHSIILASTGGYTTVTNIGTVKPDGFTVENGELRNAVLLHDRQGLALFSDEGIRAIDLKSNTIHFPNGAVLESPYKSILAYSKLLKWCKDSKATVFQTHILANDNSMLISPSKAPPTLRERRLLALLSDKNGNVIHAVFDITSPYDLALIAQEIFNIISSRGLKVDGILNLDTGAFNILNVFDEHGSLVTDVKGSRNISTATNLVVYYK